MIGRSESSLTNYWDRWVKKRNRLGSPQTLDSRNLYILPSGFGWVYALVVLTIFIGAINSQLNPLFLMTFILTIIGLISILEAHANLKNLSFKVIGMTDSYQGSAGQNDFIDSA